MLYDRAIRASGLSPLRDGRTPLFVEVGADPTVAPGLQLPMGSIAAFGTSYYFKNAAAATGWTLVTNIGSAALTVDAPLTGAGTPASHLSIPASDDSPLVDGYMSGAQALALVTATANIASLTSSLAAVANARSLEETLRASALSDLGLTATPERMLWGFRSFSRRSYGGATLTDSSGGSGAVNGSAYLQGMLVTTNAASGARMIISEQPNGGANELARMFGGTSAKKWWLSVRMAGFSAAPSVTNARCGLVLCSGSLSSPTVQVILGMLAAQSNWCVQSPTVPAVLTTSTAKDVSTGASNNNFHTLKAYRVNGADTLLSIDGGAPVTGNTGNGGNVFPGSNAWPAFLVETGNTAASLSAFGKWIAFATEIEDP